MSEFRIFLDNLKAKGIEYRINWGPTKEDWQVYITRAGWNITALACNIVVVGYDHYIFCSGPVDPEQKECWIHLHPQALPHEQPDGGMFLCSHNISTGELKDRNEYGEPFQVTDLPHVTDVPNMDDRANAFLSLVDHWCPEGCRHEEPINRLGRAFLQALSCVEQHRLKEQGQQPIRPLDSFPTPTYTEKFHRAF